MSVYEKMDCKVGNTECRALFCFVEQVLVYTVIRLKNRTKITRVRAKDSSYQSIFVNWKFPEGANLFSPKACSVGLSPLGTIAHGFWRTNKYLRIVFTKRIKQF